MGNLKFIFGPSGSGKTTKIYKDILKLASENHNKNFLVIVPDQFTMQTQMQLSRMSKSGGILNIDVLSFGRLTHRIMTEVGWSETPVLDDTGKCLVLQRVAGRISDRLPVLGNRLGRQGYIHEVKSVISEFMQYGLSPSDIDKINETMKGKGAFNAKLSDLRTLYEEFKKYIEGNFITREEKLDILREIMPSSRVLSESIVVFDGFTGFTPIQINVIEDIMALADETWVSLVLGKNEKIEDCQDMQSLFYLSGKTYDSLIKRAKNVSAEVLPSEYCDYVYNAPGIHFLGENIFRTGKAVYKESTSEHKNLSMPDSGAEEKTARDIVMFQASNISEEVHQAALYIARELRNSGDLQYRDIVLVTGDLEGYAPYYEREFTRMNIPYFLDRTNGIRLNPVIEGIRSILGIFMNNFSEEAVFRYLRSGISGFEENATDELEAFVRKTGVRGYKAWSRVFEYRTAWGEEAKKDKDKQQKIEAELSAINETRASFMKQTESFFKASGNVSGEEVKVPGKNTKKRVSEYVFMVYDFLENIDVFGKLCDYADEFAKEGDLVREKEYRQVYKKVCELLEQVTNLLGEDEITLKEFYEILDAGFGEIRIGTIPGTVDKVLIGDIERTRVPSAKILFFMGANDGNIPKNTDKGGIISDLERESLRENGFELAPTPREEMYSQRLYLYMNMTKPKDRLYISFAGLDSSGKSLRPSYICEMVKRMFPDIKLQNPERERITEQIVGKKEGLRFLADELRRYAEIPNYKDNLVYTLYSAFGEGEKNDKRKCIKEAAFSLYKPVKLDKSIAEKIYCDASEEGREDEAILRSSISRLESYTLCHYGFFLKYGLRLKEDEIFEIKNTDTGNIFHSVLEQFSDKLKEDGLAWTEFDDKYAEEKVGYILEEITDVYGSSVFMASERTRHSIKRLKNALVNSVLTIRYQIKKGKFIPSKFEVPFKSEMPMKAQNGKKRTLRLRGKIDRVDTANDGGEVFVRIVDYKSSAKSLDLNKVYDGRQMQLPMYMAQELDRLRKENITSYPAGMFYYHVEDPVINVSAPDDDEKNKKERIKASKLSGYVTNDDRIISMNDEELSNQSGDSDVIRVTYKADKTTSAASKVMSMDDMNAIMTYTKNIACEMGEEILDGDITINPIEGDSCNYCAFKASCPLDARIKGYSKRTSNKMDDKTIMKAIREKNSGN
ncbi:MAG: exodeoxyribonuclease V subunit gamma [Lachnospiraceae bacterium]|nr:exodeoxyribonuclease V subunit gamma [Lachnospiraceae bacterium]